MTSSDLKSTSSYASTKKAAIVAKYTSAIAWFFGFCAIILIIVINTAGTSTENSGKASESRIVGQDCSIISFTIPYNDIYSDNSLAWTYRLYLNGAWLSPRHKIADTVGPVRLHNIPGQIFNLTSALHEGDTYLVKSVNATFNRATVQVPTSSAQQMQISSIPTIVPFVLYMLSIGTILVALITLPRGCCGLKWSFGRKFLNLTLITTACSFTSAAAGMLTYFAIRASRELHTGDHNTKHVVDVTISTIFLAWMWTISALLFVAVVLLTLEWGMEKRDVNSLLKKGKVWKATGTGIFGGLKRHRTWGTLDGYETISDHPSVTKQGMQKAKRKDRMSLVELDASVGPERDMEMDSSRNSSRESSSERTIREV